MGGHFNHAFKVNLQKKLSLFYSLRSFIVRIHSANHIIIEGFGLHFFYCSQMSTYEKTRRLFYYSYLMKEKQRQIEKLPDFYHEHEYLRLISVKLIGIINELKSILLALNMYLYCICICNLYYSKLYPVNNCDLISWYKHTINFFTAASNIFIFIGSSVHKYTGRINKKFDQRYRDNILK